MVDDTNCLPKRSEIHKMLVLIANREDPDQIFLSGTALFSDLPLWDCTVCLNSAVPERKI